MLLKRCYIGSFGKLQDFTYDFSEGLNVICEENGWGKSTFAAFIRAMLYGMPQAGSRTKLEEAERRKYKPWQGGKLGGYLIFEANGKTYKAERTFGTKEAEDTFRLTDLSTNLESSDFSAELGKELFGLDKEAYSRSTYLPQSKISDGGMNDSIGKKLGRMAEGEEESGNYDKAYEVLEELRKKYIPDRQKDEKGYVAELNRRITDTQMRLENCRRKEENARPWRERERAAAEKRKELEKALDLCQEKQKIATDYEAAASQKRLYGELCMQEEKARQQKENIERLLFAGVPEAKEITQCLRETEEAMALSGELRSYEMSEAELQNCKQKEKEIEEKLAKAEELCARAEEEEQRAGRTGKGLLLGGVLLLVLAAVLLIKTMLGAAGTAVIGFCLIGVWFLMQKKKQEAGQKRERCLSELATYRELAGEYCRLAEKRDKYQACLERKRTLLVRSETLLQKYRIDTEDIVGGLYRLEQQRKDYYSFSEKFAEAVEKREQFEQEHSPEKFCNVVPPKEGLEELREKERNLKTQIAGLEAEEKDAGGRAESFEEEAAAYGECAEQLNGLKEELAAKQREHTLIEETIKCLKTAKAQFSSRYMRGLLKSFREYVELLGGESINRSMNGRFDDVVADVNLQVQVTAYGQDKEMGYFSTGMRDLMSLCMRLALVDAMFKEEEPFLILDDPFVNLDEEKLERALRLLRRTSERYQILYLVCHSSRA